MDLLMFCVCVVVFCTDLPLLMYKSQTYEQMQAEKKQFADKLFESKPKKNPKKVNRKVNNKKGKAKESNQMDRKKQKYDNNGHSSNASGERNNDTVHSSDKGHVELEDAVDSQRKVQTLIDVLDKVNLTNGKIRMLVNYLLNKQPDTTISANQSDAILQMLHQQLDDQDRELAAERKKFRELSAEIISERTNSQNEIGRLTDELYAKNAMIDMILQDQKQYEQVNDEIFSKMQIVVNRLLDRLQGEAANTLFGDKQNAASVRDEMSQRQQ